MIHGLLYLCAALILIGSAHGASAEPDLREIKRKLWVLGYSVERLDGRDDAKTRASLQKFASDRKLEPLGLDTADKHLSEAVEERRKERLAPFSQPKLVERPVVDGYRYLNSIHFAPEENLMIAGECELIKKYDASSGIPLADLQGIISAPIFYSRTHKVVACPVHWGNDIVGVLLVDIHTGMALDFIELSTKASRISPKIRGDADGRILFVAFWKSIWKVSLDDRSIKLIEREMSGPASLDEMIVSSDGRILMAHNQKRWNIYETDTGKRIFTWKSDDDDVVLSDDGALFAARVQYDAPIEIRDTRTGQLIVARKFEDDLKPDIDQSRTGRKTVFSPDRSALLFVAQVEGETALYRWQFSSNAVEKVTPLADFEGEAVIDGGKIYALADTGIRTYRISDGKPLLSANGSRRLSPAAAAVSHDGKRAALIGDGEIVLVDATSGQQEVRAALEMSDVKAATFLEDGRIAVGGTDGRISLYSAQGRKLSDLPVLKGDITGLRAARSRPYLAVRSTIHSAGKSSYHIHVFDYERSSIVYEYRSAKYGLGSGLGFVDSDRRLLFGEEFDLVVADLATRSTILRQQLKTNVTRTKSRTQWNHSFVGFVTGPLNPGEPTLVAAASLPAASVIYQYRNGQLTLYKGSTTGGAAAENYLIARHWGVVLANDGKLVGLMDKTPVVSDLQTDRFDSLEPLKADPMAVGSTPDGGILTIDQDAEIRLYSRSSNEPLLRTIIFSGGNWLTLSKKGYFAGTQRAAENLFVALSHKDGLTIDSFYETLYRPDLVATTALPSSDSVKPLPATEPDLASLTKDGLPPIVTVLSPEPSSTVQTETIRVKGRVEVRSGGVSKVEWRVNGITRVVHGRPEASTFDDDLLVEPGENVIELVAYTIGNRVSSTPARIKIAYGSAGQVATPRLYFLGIGVNDYWDSRLTLRFATQDVLSVAKAFENGSKDLFDSSRIITLFDKQVTKNNIEAAFAQIGQTIRSTDVFVLYVAGHGKTEEGKYYYLPHDFQYDGPSSFSVRAIGQDDWQSWMTRIAARKSLLMFDTCESGTLTAERLTRGFDKVAALDRLTRATGRSVLAAASDTGPAIEGFQGHGLFTYALLEGMGTSDPSRNGLVQVAGLASYISQRVPDISFGKFGIRQVPQMKLTGEDFPISRVYAALQNVDEAFIPIQPTHVVTRQTQIVDAQGVPLSSDILSAGLLVRITQQRGDLAGVARSGRFIGYVKADDLVPLQ